MTDKLSAPLFVLSIGLLSAWLFCTGCAGSLKKSIAQDLSAIIQTQNCPIACEALKVYLRAKLGVDIPNQPQAAPLSQ